MSNDRYSAWIAGQIADHEPSADHNAMYRLAEATAALSTGAGMVFGMMMPPDLLNRDELAAQALEVLRKWIPQLDEGATEQLAELATRANLPLDLSARRAEHTAKRRAAIDERIAKSQTLDARYTDLERAIVENPEDRDAWLVLSDFQQSKGDPRGELVALQLAGEADEAKLKASKSYLQKHREALLGPLAEHEKVHDGSKTDAFTWRRGFIHAARLSCPDDDADASAIVELLLRHPSGRFLSELTIGMDGIPSDGDLSSVIHVLAEQMVPTLRKLHLGDFEYPDECEMSWFNVGDLKELWRAVPRLAHLIVQGNFTLGEVAHDKLERLELRTGGLPAVVARSVSAATLPNIRWLEVWYGSEGYGGDASFFDVAPLLARHDLPLLRHLGLRNCEFTDEICDGIAKSRVLRQLESLDLSMGTMSDTGVEAIVAFAPAFKHLKTIDVSDSWISNDALAQLKKLGPTIIDHDQQEADGPEDRYVSVGE
jgi:uncharacterized protein (TIGR02996 family)